MGKNILYFIIHIISIYCLIFEDDIVELEKLMNKINKQDNDDELEGEIEGEYDDTGFLAEGKDDNNDEQFNDQGMDIMMERGLKKKKNDPKALTKNLAIKGRAEPLFYGMKMKEWWDLFIENKKYPLLIFTDQENLNNAIDIKNWGLKIGFKDNEIFVTLLKIPYGYSEKDKNMIKNYEKIKKELEEVSGRDSFPLIFIKDYFIGQTIDESIGLIKGDEIKKDKLIYGAIGLDPSKWIESTLESNYLVAITKLDDLSSTWARRDLSLIDPSKSFHVVYGIENEKLLSTFLNDKMPIKYKKLAFTNAIERKSKSTDYPIIFAFGKYIGPYHNLIKILNRTFDHDSEIYKNLRFVVEKRHKVMEEGEKDIKEHYCGRERGTLGYFFGGIAYLAHKNTNYGKGALNDDELESEACRSIPKEAWTLSFKFK